MPRFGGPVFRSTSSSKTKFSSLNNMWRIREGRTWKFLVVSFGGPVFSSALSRKTKCSSLDSMWRIREGCTWKFHCNLYIKCQDLEVQFSVVLRVGKLSLVV